MNRVTENNHTENVIRAVLDVYRLSEREFKLILTSTDRSHNEIKVAMILGLRRFTNLTGDAAGARFGMTGVSWLNRLSRIKQDYTTEQQEAILQKVNVRLAQIITEQQPAA